MFSGCCAEIRKMKVFNNVLLKNYEKAFLVREFCDFICRKLKVKSIKS